MNIVLITSNYPFGTGEPFLADELLVWAQDSRFEVHILPARRGGFQRTVPSRINFHGTALSDISFGIAAWLKIAGRALFGRRMREEMVKVSLADLRMIFSLIYSGMKIEVRIARLLAHPIWSVQPDLVYTYWNTETTYASQEVSRIKNIPVVSRIHGFDLYRWERRDTGLMPYKERYLSRLNKLFVLSNSAKDYVIKEYGCEPERIEVARLGVFSGVRRSGHGTEKLEIVSCSNTAAVKCLFKIPLVLLELSNKYGVASNWTHIGDGPGLEDLKNSTNEVLKESKSVTARYLGHLPRDEIYNEYATHNYDVFLNVSESEGQPVSIMEAMSFGLPVVAPDVGGISEMVDDHESAILVSKNGRVSEIAYALSKVEFFRCSETRNNSYKKYKTMFDAKTNYTEFIEKAISVTNSSC